MILRKRVSPKNIKLDEFIIMPTHIHGLIIIKDNKINIKNKNILTIGINNQNIISAVGAIHKLPLREQQIKKKKYRQTRRQMLLPKMIGKFKINSAKQINNILKTIDKPVW